MIVRVKETTTDFCSLRYSSFTGTPFQAAIYYKLWSRPKTPEKLIEALNRKSKHKKSKYTGVVYDVEIIEESEKWDT